MEWSEIATSAADLAASTLRLILAGRSETSGERSVSEHLKYNVCAFTVWLTVFATLHLLTGAPVAKYAVYKSYHPSFVNVN